MYIDVPVIEAGEGPVVVLLHGGPHHKEEWLETIELLQPNYRCLAPDLPGFGQAGMPPSAYDFSIDAQVAFFDAWVDRWVGERPFVLVGHDIGAIMGMAWASQHGQQLIGIIAMNTIIHADVPWHTMAKIWSNPILGPLFMHTLTRFTFTIGFRKDFPEVTKSQTHRLYKGLTRTARKSLLQLFRKMIQADFFKGWEKAFETVVQEIPTTVLWGHQDPLIPKEYPYRIGGQLKLLADVGHWVPLEHPQAIASSIQELMAAYAQRTQG